MTLAPSILPVRKDSIDECIAYFSRNLQARISRVQFESSMPALKKIALQLGLSSEEELFNQLIHGHAKAIAALEAYFFRPSPVLFDGPGMFKTFESILLPQLITQNNAQKRLSIWLPSCGRGLEAYSLALVLYSHKKELSDWDLSVHATDTDTLSLDSAELGAFESPPLDPILSKLYGAGLKRSDDEYILRKEVRDLIRFQHAHLLDSEQVQGPYNVIIFRNQLKHWEPDLQEKIVAKFEESLVPYGHLILAYGESLLGLSNQFKLSTTIQGFYQRSY